MTLTLTLTLTLTSKVYVLHQCGAGDAPPDAELPAHAVGAPVFTVPVQSWSTGMTVPLGFLEKLGLTNKGAIIEPSYVSSGCMLKLAGCGEIATMSDTSGGATGAWAGNVSASGSAVHFTDKMTWLTGASYSAIDVAFDTATDPGVLNRAEWIKFVAAFFNLEPHANRVFAEIKADFEQIKAQTAAALAGGAVAPKVLWLAKNSWESFTKVSTASYKLDYVASAGGVTPSAADLLEHCTNASATDHLSAADIALGYYNFFMCDAAGLKAVLAGIDVVIDETGGLADYALRDFMNTHNLDADFVTTHNLNKVLRLDRLMAPDKVTKSYGVFQGSAWQEEGLIKGDVALKDLVSYLHPTLVPSDYAPYFFRNIADAETVTLASASTCDDPYATCQGETAPPSPPVDRNYCNGGLCVLAAPPSPPPSPLPPPPPVSDKHLTLTLTAAGAVSDYTDVSALKQKVATAAGVDVNLVTITVAAGSVIITATITVPAGSSVKNVQASLDSTLGTTTATASTALGIEVEAVPVVVSNASPPPPPPPSPPPPSSPKVLSTPESNVSNDDDDEIALVAGLVGGLLGAAVLCLLVFVCYMYTREKQGKPIFQALDETKVVGGTAGGATAAENKI